MLEIIKFAFRSFDSTIVSLIVLYMIINGTVEITREFFKGLSKIVYIFKK